MTTNGRSRCTFSGSRSMLGPFQTSAAVDPGGGGGAEGRPARRGSKRGSPPRPGGRLGRAATVSADSGIDGAAIVIGGAGVVGAVDAIGWLALLPVLASGATGGGSGSAATTGADALPAGGLTAGVAPIVVASTGFSGGLTTTVSGSGSASGSCISARSIPASAST